MIPTSGLRRVMGRDRIKLVFGVKSWTPEERGGGRGGAADEHDDDVNVSSLREGYCHLMDDLLDSEWPYLS
jgi:hypothetical protein